MLRMKLHKQVSTGLTDTGREFENQDSTAQKLIHQ